MSILLHNAEFDRIAGETLAAWQDVPPAIATDSMHRSNVMAARIKPIAHGMKLCGQARTVHCMVGDNGPIHAAMRLIRDGDVLVIDAGGYHDVAVWGGMLTREAMARGCGGVVVDGAIRDAAEIRELGFACFSAAIVPRGPHKGFGGQLDGVISCGACAVAAGDLILGDDDGVAVVPIAQADAVLARCREKIVQEKQWAKLIAEGGLLADIIGVPQPEPIDQQR